MTKKHWLRLLFLSLLLGGAWSLSLKGHQSARSLVVAELWQLITFNIRYDNPQDYPNSWQERRDALVAFLKEQQADVLGLQEVLAGQMDYLSEALEADYYSIGVGREDGKRQGEYTPIFYKKSRLSLQEQGYLWLSETPQLAGSKGWDAACERMVTYAVFRDKKGEPLIVLNTHLDHVGKEARRQSVRLIDSLSRELSSRYQTQHIALLGDLNVSPQDQTIGLLEGITLEGGIALRDSYAMAERSGTPRRGSEGTFHNWGKISPEKSERIDYILLPQNTDIYSYETYEALHPSGVYLSDHKAVGLTLSWEKSKE